MPMNRPENTDAAESRTLEGVAIAVAALLAAQVFGTELDLLRQTFRLLFGF